MTAAFDESSLVEWTPQIVVRVQLGGKRKYGGAIVAGQGGVDLGNDLSSREWIIHTWAGRIQQSGHCGSE